MHIPARILRKHALDVDRTLRDLSVKEVAREQRILKTAAHLIARFGLPAISFTNLAVALSIAQSTLRRHFTDLDALAGEIMRRHLQTISQAIGAVPRGSPNRASLQRAAYIDATRIIGAPTQAHLILITYRASLAEDERETIEDLRTSIGYMLWPENPEGALLLLDSPCFDGDQIEAMLQATQTRPAEARPAPQPTLARQTAAPTQAVAPDPAGALIPLPWESPERLGGSADPRRNRAPPDAVAA